MKRLTCELCNSTDFMKENGAFVCQSCGTKYSLEEAKKMMSESGDAETGKVEVKNAAQLDNLMSLARSSFDSQNYAQAEAFCNQIIAMDDQNHEAWKLKGEAINYQIGTNNQRILEVYNCLMTSYRVLNAEQQEEKKYGILDTLKTCLEGEVGFWLQQFEAQRPTDAALLRVKNSYYDSRTKITNAFDEMGFSDSKEAYLINFDNFFVGKCNAICNSAWKSTVAYNYYRDYMGKGQDPFGRSDMRWVIEDTDLYRPTKHIWDTFITETDNLISLLQFAESHFNDETNLKVMEAIYSNIVYFEECVIPSGSWKITQGFTSNWDQYQTVGWHEEYNLTDAAKQSRRRIIDRYKEKGRTVPRQVEARQRAQKEKERKERTDKYWEEHAQEKAALESERDQLQEKMKELSRQIDAIDQKNVSKIRMLRNERDKKLPGEEEVEEQRKLIRQLNIQKDNCGIFKGKEKRALQERIDTEETPKLKSLMEKAETEKKQHQQKVNNEIDLIRSEGKELRAEVEAIRKRIEAIVTELTKDR